MSQLHIFKSSLLKISAYLLFANRKLKKKRIGKNGERAKNTQDLLCWKMQEAFDS
jgi:hypothetical protein